MRRRVAVFTPAFEQLVAQLRGRVRLPADWDSWEQDDRDDFKHARQDVSDALLDAAGASPWPLLSPGTWLSSSNWLFPLPWCPPWTLFHHMLPKCIPAAPYA